jgi:hypothetical protein
LKDVEKTHDNLHGVCMEHHENSLVLLQRKKVDFSVGYEGWWCGTPAGSNLLLRNTLKNPNFLDISEMT